MFCENCGEKLKAGAQICLACGNPVADVKVAPAKTVAARTISKAETKVEPKVEPIVETKVQKPAEVKTTAQTLAIIGFVLSFLSITVGSICSWIALVKYKYQENKELRRIAVAGIIISLVKLGIIAFALLISLFAASGAMYVL